MYAQTFSHREVAVDIVRIILAWSKREEAEGKDRISNHIEVEKQVKYIIVHALIRLSTTIYATEDKEAKVGERQIIELSYKALVLLRDTFHLWSNIEIKLEQIKMINMNPEKRLQTLYIKLTLLNLMRIIFKYHDPAEVYLYIYIIHIDKPKDCRSHAKFKSHSSNNVTKQPRTKAISDYRRSC